MFIRCVVALLTLTVLGACQTTDSGNSRASRTQLLTDIKNEPPGNYFVGRRYYKLDYKFWGFVRKPNQPWSTAQLVMLNEQQKLAPDRATGKIGSDNDYEYKLYGAFSGATVYEPASNGFYPEFVLKGYELISAKPPNIYQMSGATDPSRRVIVRPY
jgi:hypothetical protein